MWKIRKLDEQLFDGAAAKIHAFLDIEPLMPPGRLRLSKLLGRPVMLGLQCNCTAIADIEELRGTDCQVHGGEAVFNLRHGVLRYRHWMGMAWDAPDLVGACVISAEDKAWGLAWHEKERNWWPGILVKGESRPHPALLNLVIAHEWFHERWEADMNMVGYEEPDASKEFGTCPTCSGTYIGGAIEVTEIDGVLYETGRQIS